MSAVVADAELTGAADATIARMSRYLLNS